MFAPSESCGDAQEISWKANAREARELGHSLPASGLEAERYAGPKRQAPRGFSSGRTIAGDDRLPQARSIEPLAGVIINHTERAKRYVGASPSSSRGRGHVVHSAGRSHRRRRREDAINLCTEARIRSDQWGLRRQPDPTHRRAASGVSCSAGQIERRTAGIRAMAGDRQRMPPALIQKWMFSARHARANLARASTRNSQSLGSDASSQQQSRSCRAAVRFPSACARPIASDGRLLPEGR